MANDSYSQQRLAQDQAFQGRVRAALAAVAFEVLEEDASTANHAARETYARAVINSLTMFAVGIAPWLVMRTNLIGAATSYDMVAGAVVTAADDAAIESQLHSDWDILAGQPTVPGGV